MTLRYKPYEEREKKNAVTNTEQNINIYNKDTVRKSPNDTLKSQKYKLLNADPAQTEYKIYKCNGRHSISLCCMTSTV